MRVALAVLLASLAAAGPAAAAVPEVHAHRGGALTFGVPTTPEDTLPAFRAAAAIPGTWLELDSVVTQDGVPVVLHDSTLDRTTDCEGVVLERTIAQVEACRVDVLGVSENLAPAPVEPVVRVPRLAEVLAFAKERGVGVNLEIKRIPGDPGYVPGDTSFARAVMDVVVAAGLDPAKLIVQSFDPSNLEVAKAALPGVRLSLLTLQAMNEGAPEVAAASGYEWVSPGGVPSAAFMARARALGRKVVPYTLNTEADVRAAAAAGVDAIITDDVALARRALGLPQSVPAGPAKPPAARPRTSPRVTVVPRTLAATLRRGGFPVTLRAARAARAQVTARLGSVVVASASVRLRGAGTRRALVRLTPAGRRALASRRGAVRLRVAVALDGGRATARLVTLR